MYPRSWSSAIIDAALPTGDPEAIAQALAASPEFVAAIRRGMEIKITNGVLSPTRVEFIRLELQRAFAVVPGVPPGQSRTE
jgi:hypothetical protein